jgi:hypothetical protein
MVNKIYHWLVKGENGETQPVFCFMPRNDPPGMRHETNRRSNAMFIDCS